MNCLVKKLKESINNNNLEKLDYIVYRIDAGINITAAIRAKTINACSITTDGTVTCSASSVPTNGTITISGGARGGYVYISNKKQITYLQNANLIVPLYSINYCSNLLLLSFGAITNGEELKLTDIIHGCLNLETLQVSNSSKIIGDIAALGSFTKLNSLSFSRSGITGTIEDFVKNQRLNGRITCDYLLLPYAHSSSITFDGGLIMKPNSSSNEILSWASDWIEIDGKRIYK